MIVSIEHTPTKWDNAKLMRGGRDACKDARNIRERGTVKLRLNQRGLQDLLIALASAVDGASGVSYVGHDCNINIEVVR